MYVIIWEFRVDTPHRAAFEQAYGPGGDWARLFSRDAQFCGTQLLHDGKRYLTVDSWSSKTAYDAFRASVGAEYSSLDARCEALTLDETPIGAFETLP